MVILKTLVGNLSANVNEITFTDAIINSNSIIEVYYNSNDIYTVETWQRENTIGIVTSDHNFPVSVKVLINNVVAFEPYDDTSLVIRIDDLEDRMSDAENAISDLTGRVGDAEDDIDALEDAVSNLNTSKQDVLTAGDNITIENNVISASGGGANNVYSTEEHVVGTYLNKPLYEKTVVYENITTGRVDNLLHNIANINIIVKCEYGFYSTDDSVDWIGFESNDARYWTSIFQVTRTSISYRIGTAWGATRLRINMFYTKTTD